MYKHRINARVDENQQSLVEVLRQIPGVSVQTGHDDLLVGYQGRTHWIEVKNPKEVRKDGKLKAGALKPSQKALIESWTGSYHVVHHLDQVLEIIGAA